MNDPEIDKELGRLVPKPMPPGLRERVLRPALQARRKAALSPGMKWAAAVGLAVIAAVLMIDPVVGGWESARLAALLDGRPAGPAAGEAAIELAETAGLTAREADRLARLLDSASSAAQVQRQRNLGETLKGAERMIGI